MSTQVGELKNYGTMWYDPKGIANILSFKKVREKYAVAYDATNKSFTVTTKPNGKVFVFKELVLGLHYLDTKAESGVALVNTVAGNHSSYSNDDYLWAVSTRELQVKIGWLSLCDIIHIIENNHLPNCPVTKADIMAAERIFGPDIGSLKGKTTQHNPHAIKQVVEPLPPEIMSQYWHVTLCADIMYINGIPFIMTLSRNIKFGMVKAIINQKQ